MLKLQGLRKLSEQSNASKAPNGADSKKEETQNAVKALLGLYPSLSSKPLVKQIG